MRDTIIAYLQQQREMYGNVTYATTPATPLMIPDETQAEAPPIVEAPRASHDPMESPRTLAEFEAQISSCLNCALGSTRTKFVFGSGNPNADILVVGEAPGADEDEQGLPFVGRAGQLLTKILEAVNLRRDEVYICNILKCRPPGNRKPLTSETDQCEPYLWEQINLIKPKFILALGLTAANTLLKNKESMTNLRGKTHDYHGIPLLVTYHPAALLRNPDWKRHTWEDVKYLRTLYDATQ